MDDNQEVSKKIVPLNTPPAPNLLGSVRYKHEADLLAPVDEVWEAEQCWFSLLGEWGTFVNYGNNFAERERQTPFCRGSTEKTMRRRPTRFRRTPFNRPL